MRAIFATVALVATPLALVTLPSWEAAAVSGPAEGLDTTLITRSLTGGLPNGPSSHASISRDQRYARALAFQSSATDLVSTPVAPTTNIYYVQRRPPLNNLGVPWMPGPIQLASPGVGSQPADGPSFGPAVSGDNRHPPRCVAFVSVASNLVGGDTNGRPDAFVFDLRTRAVQRVSVSTTGAQSDGTAYDVAVNGDCSKVAFTDDASHLVAGTSGGIKQVYVRDLRRGETTIASAAHHIAGNADSSHPAFGRHDRLAFSSAATNLAGPTAAHRQVLLRSGRRLSMLSRTASGAPGDGDSDQPALSQGDTGVAFRTTASKLAPAAGSQAGRFPQVVRSRDGRVLRTAGPASNGAAGDPDVANNGHYVLYDSADPALGSPVGSAGAAYLYTDVRNLVIPVSVDSSGQRLRLPGSNPASSEVSNYIFFETPDPAADLRFARSQGTANVPPELAAVTPAFHQIYLRYLGPK